MSSTGLVVGHLSGQSVEFTAFTAFRADVEDWFAPQTLKPSYNPTIKSSSSSRTQRENEYNAKRNSNASGISSEMHFEEQRAHVDIFSKNI